MKNAKNILSALLGRLSIVHCPLLIVLLLLTGCRDEADTLPTDGNRTITLDLGIALTRATEKDQPVYGEASDLHVWLFDQEDNFLGYIPEEDPQFTGRDLQGNPVESIEAEFDITNVTSIQIRVLLNINELTLQKPDGTTLTLGENSTIAEIDDATFQFGTTLPDGDNKVPMYGATTLDNISASRHYPVTVELTRAVGKLELFFTKESETSTLTISNLTLEHIPNIGYLNEGATQTEVTYTETKDDILSVESISVQTSLSAETSLGDFSAHEEDFTPLPLTNAYLLENPNGETWTENAPDYTYPYDDETTSITDENTRYKLTVSYTLGNTKKTQIIYLPAIKRNMWNKIFARVKDEEGTLEIKYQVLPWNVVSSAIGYAPQHIPTDHNPFDADEAWEESDIANGDYYVLFPIQPYKSSGEQHTTSGLLKYLYDTPEEGDNEARLCIITRPTYTDDEHDCLKIGSAGARYFFLLTGPEGATWTAHLTDENEEENFSFSNSSDDDFKNSAEYDTPEHDNGYVRKTIHGIARKKPYVIQIIANHLYTGYEEDMSGEVTKEMEDNDGFADIKNNWDDYFEDRKYLTEWGKDKWDNEEVVDTEFYITVKLKDGEEYELKINPEYTDTELKSSQFPFKDRRRYAGTDTRIWIRQIRAQYGWKNLEFLAQDRDPSENGNEEWEKYQWWMENKYWNKNHEWSK